jgi:hypothetical protein
MARFRGSLLILMVLFLTLTACGGTPAPEATSTPTGPVIGWDPTPGRVILRLDRVLLKDEDRATRNRLPPCTLYGDGRLVWVNPNPPSGEEVLEAYLNELQMRDFLVYVIRDAKFYSVPDYAAQELPPTEDAALESISLNLYQEQKTVRSYRGWPGNTYLDILNRCKTVSEVRAVVEPFAGWVTVYAVERSTALPEIGWSPAAPFKMAEAAASGQPIWVSGVALRQLWRNERQTLGRMQWIEQGKAYRVAIQVPGISRDAPPPPPGSETPTPVPTETDTP